MSVEERLFYGIIFGLLILASVIGRILRRPQFAARNPALVEETVIRINAWWVMSLLVISALLIGRWAVVLLFALISLGALREYLTLVPTRRGDHRAMFWSFSIIAPIHYLLVGTGWYGLFTIFIPVYAFLLIPSRLVVQQDCTAFLERAAKIQWGLMLCVYAVSHAPALLWLDIPGYGGRERILFVYLLFLTESSDILQFIAGKLVGKRPIAPAVSPKKTWEGFVGGLLGVTIFACLLAPLTPFSRLVSSCLGALIVVMGFLGGLTMSAIKRDAGVKDYGTVIAGHGGVLDRIDSLCFSAPIFFHLVRYFFTT